MQRTESPWALGGMCNHLESIPRRTARVCLEPHLVALAGIRHPPEPRLAQLTDQFIRRTISRTGFLSRKCIRRVALRYASKLPSAWVGRQDKIIGSVIVDTPAV